MRALDYEIELKALIDQSIDIERKDPKKSLEFGLEAHELAKKLQNEDFIGRSLFRIGRSYWLLSEYEEAFKHLMLAYAISDKIKDNDLKTHILNAIGNVNYDLGSYNEGLNFYMKALRMAEDNRLILMRSSILNNIGEIYKALESYDEALKYYFESLNLSREHHLEKVEAISLLNVAKIYYFKEDYELAQEYNHLALEKCIRLVHKIGEYSIYYQLGQVNEALGQKVEALDYYEKSKKLCFETGERKYLIQILKTMGRYYIKEKEYEASKALLLDALEIARGLNIKSFIPGILYELGNNYEMRGEFEKSSEYYKEYFNFQKDYEKKEIDLKLSALTKQFEIEKSQSENEIFRLRNVELKAKNDEIRKKSLALENSYNQIKTISKIGRDITSTQKLDEILNKVYLNIDNIVDASVFGIGLINDTGDRINFSLFVENGTKVPFFYERTDHENSFAAWVVKNKQEILINDLEKDYFRYVDTIYNRDLTSEPKSMIFVPLLIKDKCIGVMTVQSYILNNYSQMDIETIKALGSYVAIAINNSKKSEALNREIIEKEIAQENLKIAYDKLKGLSSIDGLTEIPNRRNFDNTIRTSYRKAVEEKGAISMLLLDIDYFKNYNDNYGHLSGDEVIKQVARTLKSLSIIKGVHVSRYGGEEFAIIASSTAFSAGKELGEQLLQMIRSLQLKHEYSKAAPHITISVGMVTAKPKSLDSITAFVESVDAHLYKAKEQGRDRMVAGYFKEVVR